MTSLDAESGPAAPDAPVPADDTLAEDLEAQDPVSEEWLETSGDGPLWWPFRRYPGDDEARRLLMRAASFVIVAACCGFVFWVVHPELILSDSTPTGGDMGAHVWGPAFLRDHLLPSFRLSGWTPDWYNGFPAYTFYMVVPSLAIVALDVGFVPWFLAPVVVAVAAVGGTWAWRRVSGALLRTLVATAAIAFVVLTVDVPYNVAFKLVAVSGLVTLPAAVWWFGHNLGLRFGGPELMSIASVLFLMDQTLFHIYGGNIASTMAGEFAFSISLTFAFLFLGTVARGVRTGQHVALGAVFAALCALNHVIPFLYSLGAAAVILLYRPTLRALVWVGQTALIGGALAAFWYLPFYFTSTYMNDMGWEKLGPLKNEYGVNIPNSTELWRHLLPFAPHVSDAGNSTPDPNMLHGKVFFVLAIVGIALSLVKRVRAGLVLSTIAVGAALAFRYMPQGRFWNARVLPLYYLCIYLLAAVGVYLVLVLISQTFTWLSKGARLGAAIASVAVLYLLVILGVEQLWPFVASASVGERAVLVGVLAVAVVVVALAARRPSGAAISSITVGVAALVLGVLAEVSVDAGAAVSSLQVAVGLIVVLVLLCLAAHLDSMPARPLPAPAEQHRLVTFLAPPSRRHASPLSAFAMALMAAAVVFVVLGMSLRVLPGGRMATATGADGAVTDRYEWRPFGNGLLTLSSSYFGVARSWADYNFRGLEDKVSGGVDWSEEYFGVVEEAGRVGREHGCGRMMWEYDGDRQGSYGTPMAFMLLPYFTDGCIGSQEGLYFEASATTPFHFLMQSALSARCSCAQRFDIFGFSQSPYPGFDLDLGIQQMQMLGIRYYMADSETATAAADADPRLVEVGRYTPSIPEGVAERTPYVIYEVADSPVVRGLDHLPEVWPNVPESAHDRVGPYAQWFIDPSRWDVVPASDGPEEWPRNEAVTGPGHDRLTDDQLSDAARKYTPAQIEEMKEAKANTPKLSPLPPSERPQRVREAKVSNIRTSTDSISFEVDEPGTPVLITASYFPNWKAEGADGPWRVGPNQMVVVPTSEEVSLTYGRTPIEVGSAAISVAGLALLLLVVHRGAFVVGRDPRELPGDRDDLPPLVDDPDPAADRDDPDEDRVDDDELDPDEFDPDGDRVDDVELDDEALPEPEPDPDPDD